MIGKSKDFIDAVLPANKYKHVLSPNFEQTIPTASAQGHTITANTQAAYAVIMSSKHTNTLTLQGIPDITIKVIVTSKQQTTGSREGY